MLTHAQRHLRYATCAMSLPRNSVVQLPLFMPSCILPPLLVASDASIARTCVVLAREAICAAHLYRTTNALVSALAIAAPTSTKRAQRKVVALDLEPINGACFSASAHTIQVLLPDLVTH